ncbi:MAG TPA: DUF2167 domain-containing protein [Chitinophagales bacterium]|nr:DUF2167 domain-containing protein [Chitinophagales bacterium]
MKTIRLFLCLAPCLLANRLAASDTLSVDSDTLRVNADSLLQAYYDSVESSFTYEHGDITLENGVATLRIPEGFKYLNATQSEIVLKDLWGNPNGECLGMIFPKDMGPMTDASWAFVVTYDEIGYVKDDDADKIDYNDLLKEMQKETAEANQEREKLGYERVELVGWAAQPFYDKERKILHWAKELKFGDSEANTLNYNVRVLGRKGVMVMNAVGAIDQLPEVNSNISKVLDIVNFGEGQKYSDFDPDIDEVAAWTLGGLVAGKVLAKAGFLAFILKNIKLIILGVVAAAGGIWKLMSGRGKEA